MKKCCLGKVCSAPRAGGILQKSSNISLCALPEIMLCLFLYLLFNHLGLTCQMISYSSNIIVLTFCPRLAIHTVDDKLGFRDLLCMRAENLISFQTPIGCFSLLHLQLVAQGYTLHNSLLRKLNMHENIRALAITQTEKTDLLKRSHYMCGRRVPKLVSGWEILQCAQDFGGKFRKCLKSVFLKPC